MGFVWSGKALDGVCISTSGGEGFSACWGYTRHMLPCMKWLVGEPRCTRSGMQPAGAWKP